MKIEILFVKNGDTNNPLTQLEIMELAPNYKSLDIYVGRKAKAYEVSVTITGTPNMTVTDVLYQDRCDSNDGRIMFWIIKGMLDNGGLTDAEISVHNMEDIRSREWFGITS